MGKERIRWCQWECDEKGFKMFKIKSFSKKKISYFLLVFCFFWPVRYWEVIFTGIIRTGLELSVR